MKVKASIERGADYLCVKLGEVVTAIEQIGVVKGLPMWEVERRINEENARPKRRYISPATREEVYAVYYDSLRRKIEERGTEQFPESGGRKLYGELTMIVTVNHDGRVLDTEVVESSGSRTLDRRAQAIARNAAPFGTFTPAMRRKADQIVVVSRFKFTRDDTLETRLTSR